MALRLGGHVVFLWIFFLSNSIHFSLSLSFRLRRLQTLARIDREKKERKKSYVKRKRWSATNGKSGDRAEHRGDCWTRTNGQRLVSSSLALCSGRWEERYGAGKSLEDFLFFPSVVVTWGLGACWLGSRRWMWLRSGSSRHSVPSDISIIYSSSS